MACNVRKDSRLASAFATLVCAWAVALVVLGLGTTARSETAPDAPTVVTANAAR